MIVVVAVSIGDQSSSHRGKIPPAGQTIAREKSEKTQLYLLKKTL